LQGTKKARRHSASDAGPHFRVRSSLDPTFLRTATETADAVGRNGEWFTRGRHVESPERMVFVVVR
jgi:hypothetical protein